LVLDKVTSFYFCAGQNFDRNIEEGSRLQNMKHIAYLLLANSFLSAAKPMT